ncbi:RNA-directed DNA polymerase, eukaryota, reverse transcriptase zinc-binding domain protein, partial [Tanacetum coccineum]
FWSLIEDDVVDVANHFFNNDFCPKGGNSSFIALILKTQGDLVNEVQYAFIANRQILDGPFILNEIIHWCKAKKKQTLIFKIDFEKAFDSVCWDFFDDVLKNLGFVMVSLHLSFQKVVNAGLFKGFALDTSLHLSHLFYADDVVFIGQWCDSNITTIIRVLDCFFRASGLRINLHKSKLMGIAVENSMVDLAANNIGLEDEVSLSIGGRLTLLKSVLGSMPIYYMSMFKAPIHVLNKLESIRSHFFNGMDPNVRKMTFVKWDNVLASKEKGGLGVLSFYALNCALILNFSSNWIDIIRNIPLLYNKGIDLLGSIKKKMGNGENTMFWEETWMGEAPLKFLYPRIYVLESDKNISVAVKIAHPSFGYSLRRNPIGGVEQVQMIDLLSKMEGLILPNMLDRWFRSHSRAQEFSVSSARNLIDDKTLEMVGSKTRWIKYVPIKVNIHAWRVKLNNLPTRLNLSRRGMDIESIFCPSCNSAVESTSHIFFFCSMVKDLYKNMVGRQHDGVVFL